MTTIGTLAPFAPPLPSTDARAALGRICVRPPYFALRDPTRVGARLEATVVAEAPPFLEVGPMTAAELGRHAAIAGLLHAATEQADDGRRYYLARQASCRYRPSDARYGTPVRLHSSVAELGKRDARVRVEASVAGAPLASFELRYAILPEAAFERLFRTRARPTPAAANPYGRLLATDYRRDGDAVEQVIDGLPVEACVGHFDGHPAMPVAVLMGQLSYLAGQLFDAGEGRALAPFRVVRGEIEADDLAWAGERAHFRVVRDGSDADGRRFRCSAEANGRSVGQMQLWLAPTEGPVSRLS
jgi:hypothetical protein